MICNESNERNCCNIEGLDFIPGNGLKDLKSQNLKECLGYPVNSGQVGQIEEIHIIPVLKSYRAQHHSFKTDGPGGWKGQCAISKISFPLILSTFTGQNIFFHGSYSFVFYKNDFGTR